MNLFGIVNCTCSWYDPEGGIGRLEFADMAVDLFLHGFAPGEAAKSAISNSRAHVWAGQQIFSSCPVMARSARNAAAL